MAGSLAVLMMSLDNRIYIAGVRVLYALRLASGPALVDIVNKLLTYLTPSLPQSHVIERHCG